MIAIVAELSASHLGDEERALHIIDAAARAGATHVKFQTWTRNGMVGPEGYTLQSGPWAGQKLADLYDQAYLPWEWHQTLFAAVRSHKMVPFASVFDLEALAFKRQNLAADEAVAHLGVLVDQICDFHVQPMD